MGTYTELHLNLKLRKDIPIKIKHLFEKVVTASMTGEVKQIISVDERIDYRDLNVNLLKEY